MRTTVEVAERFQGPPGTGNGGYVSGMLASYLPESIAARGVEATLRAPTPLDVSLEVASEASRIAAYSGEVLIGEAIPAELDLHVPTPPSYAQALAAQPHSAALDPRVENVVPGGVGFHPVCFCCGADVPEGIGLRVFAAPVAGFQGLLQLGARMGHFAMTLVCYRLRSSGRHWIVRANSPTSPRIFVPVCLAV